MTKRAEAEESGPGLLSGRGAPAAAVAFVLFTLYLFSIALVPIRSDNDCWWHVKSGWFISENGLPETDPFSYTAADYEWHNHEWLAQLLFYWSWEAGDASGFGGWRGAILFKTLVLWGCYTLVFFLAGRLSRNWWMALLVAALAVAIGRRTFYPRPPVISNLLLIAQVGLLVAIGEGWLRRGWAFALVPMIALWTNLHGAWMAGGIVLAAFAADQGHAHLRGRLPRLPFDVPRVMFPWRWLAVLLPLCLAATFANPFGIELYKLPARVMENRDLVASIGELQPPDFYFVIDFEFAIHAALIMALFTTRFRPRLFELLIYLFFLHQAIQHVRHMLLFSVMMVPLYARLAGEVFHAAKASLADWDVTARVPWLRRLPEAGALGIALFLMGWVVVNPREGGRIGNLFDRESFPATYTQRNLQYLSGTGYIRGRFPAHVADFIELAELEGRMYNENFYAGYLIWRLSPEEHKVFSDPRFDIFGAEIWRAERAISSGVVEPRFNGKPYWQALLDEYDVNWLIARRGTGLRARVEDSGDWTPLAIWPDDFAIYTRDLPRNEEMIRRAQSTATLTGARGPR